MHFDNELSSFFNNFYSKWSYLWSPTRNEAVKAFLAPKEPEDPPYVDPDVIKVKKVKQEVLIADIRDKFLEYEAITEQIEELERILRVKCIQIDLGKGFSTFFFVREFYSLWYYSFINIHGLRHGTINPENYFPILPISDPTITAVIQESKQWKYLLADEMRSRNKVVIDDIATFITDQQKILDRKLRDLDDVRLAMKCLDEIAQIFYQFDMTISRIEEQYSLLQRFEMDIPTEELDRVFAIRYNFTSMMNSSEDVHKQILALQGPLQVELTEGVAKFNEEVSEFDSEYESKGPMVPGIPAKEASDRRLLYQGRFDELWRKFEMYESGEKLFGLPVNEYPILVKRKKEFNLLEKLYSLYLRVMADIDSFLEMPWVGIDIQDINQRVANFQNECRRLPAGMKDWPAFIELKKKIDDFNESCPLLELMAGEGMKERHWEKLSKILNYNFDVENPAYTLGDVMNAPLLKYKDDVEDVCVGAGKEKDIEAKLKQVISDWSNVNLQFAMFKGRELLIKPAETQEIVAMLEDSIMVMNSLLSNRYNAPFKKDIVLWFQKLVNTGEILERWLIVQNLWIYLEAVFVGGDISKQLPAEAKRFSNIDKTWREKIMIRAHEIPNAVAVCTDDNVVSSSLSFLLEQLEACQKALTGYLESKRLIFPRFFFVSDPVLLEILGQASNPASIQPHLLSIFDAMAYVEFDEDRADKIIAMKSANSERVPLDMDKHVVCTGGVEVWLGKLLWAMQESVKSVLAAMAQNLSDADFDFLEGFQTFPAQVGLVGVQLLWTRDAEYALRKCKTDRHIMKNTNEKITNLLNQLIGLTILDLTKLQRIQFETMVTIHVHQKDIFEYLFKNKVRNITDFEWQKQARFYYDFETDDVTVSITDVDFLYQNEYLGVTERLVITPLTDQCYITLAQAIGMSMGGAPAGPAGTGKTETTKDMGRALGKLVVVFNCSDQMDFRGLGRIYKGLAQSGSWGCFDEFNRIELPVLSVAAQQIYIVLTAKRLKRKEFVFMDGDVVSLNPEFGLFITMNPGYAGR